MKQSQVKAAPLPFDFLQVFTVFWCIDFNGRRLVTIASRKVCKLFQMNDVSSQPVGLILWRLDVQ